MKRPYNHKLYNNRLIKDDSFLYDEASNAFKTSAFFLQIIRCQGDDIWLWKFHWEQISKALKLLTGTVKLDNAEEFVKSGLHRLIRSNRAFTHTIIEITFFKNAGPESNCLNGFSIWAKIYPSLDTWNINADEITLGIYLQEKKNISSISSLITSSSDWPRHKANSFIKQMKWDECILINHNNYFCETMESNIFIVKDNEIFTPAVETGCRIDVMRVCVIQLLFNLKYKVIESLISDKEFLFKADEIFLVDTKYGIRSVSNFQTTRFVRRVANLLIYEISMLNLLTWSNKHI